MGYVATKFASQLLSRPGKLADTRPIFEPTGSPLVFSGSRSPTIGAPPMKVFLWIQADDAEDAKVHEAFMRRKCERLGIEVIGVLSCYPEEDAITSYTATCALAEQQHALIMAINRQLDPKASADAAA